MRIISMEQSKEILRKLGVSYLKPYQELIISHILECDENKRKGKILGCLPTGSGKSLCFMYPIAAIRKRTILIYPLLSLMNDQARRFQDAGIPFVMLQGGLEQEEKQKRLRKLLTDTEAAVVTNVETLLAMQNNGTIRLFRNKTAMIVIDEAHTAVTWGESFREAYLSLPEIIESINPEIIVAFTATMNKEIEDGIRKYIFGSALRYQVPVLNIKLLEFVLGYSSRLLKFFYGVDNVAADSPYGNPSLFRHIAADFGEFRAALPGKRGNRTADGVAHNRGSEAYVRGKDGFFNIL